MKIAVIALTKNGVGISEKIAGRTGADVYVFHKHAVSGTAAFSSVSSLVADIFTKYGGLVFICAAGIAVRAIAPHLKSKFTDPAVVVVDESGKFAVSLLSGHAGGANALTESVADTVGAVPVITTATDAGGSFSPDLFAKANGLHILEPELAKAVAAAVVNGEAVGLYSDYPCANRPDIFTDTAETGVCISSGTNKTPFAATLHLIPKNIILGVGCRKGVDAGVFEDFVLTALAEAGIPLYRLAEARTVDRKKGERAILEFCKKYALPLKFYSADELMRAEGSFAHSDFVLKTVGADNVCERCAALGGGKMILPKRAGKGVTTAAAETTVSIDFERRPS